MVPTKKEDMIVVGEMAQYVHQMLFHIHPSWTHRKLLPPIPFCVGGVVWPILWAEVMLITSKLRQFMVPLIPCTWGGLMLRLRSTDLRSLDHWVTAWITAALAHSRHYSGKTKRCLWSSRFFFFFFTHSSPASPNSALIVIVVLCLKDPRSNSNKWPGIVNWLIDPQWNMWIALARFLVGSRGWYRRLV